MRAVNIEWDFDVADVLSVLDNVDIYRRADILNTPTTALAQMSDEELEKLVEQKYQDEYFHLQDEAMDLPDEIDISDGEIKDEAEVADWLCEEYGFCVRHLNIDD